jgi:hypothetical protein
VTRKALALGIVAALLAAGTAQASDSYRITAGGDQNWGPQSGGFDQTSATPLDHTDTMTDNGNAVGSVDYRIQSGPGIARASMHGNVTVPSNLAYPFNPSLQAVSTTELTVNGPGFEFNTSLNLHVDGVIDTTVCGDGRNCGALSVFIFAPSGTTAGAGSEFTSQGPGRENELGLALDPIPGGYHVHGDVTSREFGVRVGSPFTVGIVLNPGGRFGGNPAQSTFGGSFEVSFAPDGPVLNNIPPGHTVSGSHVVNNRWDDPFAGNLVVTDCDDPSLAQVTSIPGSLILRQLQDCDELALPQLTQIGGDLVIEGNADGGDLDLGGVSVGGAIDVSGNGGDLTIDVGSVGGAIDVSSNSGDLTIDAGSVGGAIDVSGNSGDLTIDTGPVGGDLDISDNPGADAINVGGGQIGGDLTITDNGTAVVNANDSLTVSGDADVETEGGGMLDLSDVAVDGDETVAADGADGVTATTGGGTTDVSILGGTAAMHVVLPDGAFDQPVQFTIGRRGDEPVQGGTTATGAPVPVDPLAGYAFTFAVPALNADARLSFTVDLAALDPGTRAALLAAIAAGSATIVSKADAPGSVYGAFARCTGAQTPEANGCVAVTTTPAVARFDGIAGHFSTYAIALLKSSTGGHGGPPGGPSAAQLRAMLRSQLVPHGKAARMRALLARGYRLRFRSLAAGTVTVKWYRLRKGARPVLIAAGKRRFDAAGTATIRVKLTPAGRRQFRRNTRLRLTAKGTFTLAAAAPVTATRRFTLRR